jgi:hypothetical protein
VQKREREEECIQILVREPEGLPPLGRIRHRSEDNIKMNLREIVWGFELDSSGSEWRLMAGAFELNNEPMLQNVGNFLSESWLLKKDSARWS